MERAICKPIFMLLIIITTVYMLRYNYNNVIPAVWTPSEMYSLDVKIPVHEQNFLHLLSVNLPTENSQSTPDPGFSDLK